LAHNDSWQQKNTSKIFEKTNPSIKQKMDLQDEQFKTALATKRHAWNWKTLEAEKIMQEAKEQSYKDYVLPQINEEQTWRWK